MAFRIGVDLGGTNIAAGLVAEDYKIIKKLSVATPFKSFEGICMAISALCMELSRGVDVQSVGIGAPGIAVHESGVIERWSTMDFEGVPLASRVKELINMPVYMENDANAAALGEYTAGAGKNAESFLMVTIGTGIGCGGVFNGSLYRGRNHAAFELGHTVIDLNGPLCSCGRRGCFEALASASALVRQAKEAAEKHPESMLNTCEISGKTVFECLRLGDETAKKVVSKYIEYLASGITSVINLVVPQTLCIGGGLSGAGDDLFIPLKERVSSEEYARGCKFRTVILPALLGNDAGIIGAAAIPLYL